MKTSNYKRIVSAIVFILLIIAIEYTCEAQSTIIKHNNSLITPQPINNYTPVEVFLSKNEDSLIIRGSKPTNVIQFVQIRRVIGENLYPTPKLLMFPANTYIIPLYKYPEGTYSVQVQYGRHIYPFRMYRVLPLSEINEQFIKTARYRVEYEVNKNFGGHITYYDNVPGTMLNEFLEKINNDKNSRNGQNNELRVFVIYTDKEGNEVESLHYRI